MTDPWTIIGWIILFGLAVIGLLEFIGCVVQALTYVWHAVLGFLRYFKREGRRSGMKEES